MEAKLVRYESEAITNAVGQIAVTATKEEWTEVIEKNLWIPDAALKENDAFSGLVHWLINQGVYE